MKTAKKSTLELDGLSKDSLWWVMIDALHQGREVTLTREGQTVGRFVPTRPQPQRQRLAPVIPLFPKP